jgi:hypothetical protein
MCWCFHHLSARHIVTWFVIYHNKTESARYCVTIAVLFLKICYVNVLACSQTPV